MMWPEKIAVEIVAVEIVAAAVDVAAEEEAVEVVVAADEKCRCTLRPMMLVGFFNISEHHSKISSSGIKFFRILL